jgi:alpha-galactosidase
MLNGFAVEYNGELYTESTGFRVSGDAQSKLLSNGAVENATVFKSHSNDLEILNVTVTYPDLHIVEKWVKAKNISREDLTLSRIDSMNGILQKGKYNLKYYTSSWGKEFAPAEETLKGTRILEITSGRSSHGMHPWFSLKGESGSILTCSIAWSGNWIARFEPCAGGQYRISGGLSNWNFFKTLKPGESIEGAHIIYVYLPEGDLDDTSNEFGRWGRKYCYPQNALIQSMPCEWNSWWPYEDVEVNEDVFKANVDIGQNIGTDVCTLDAGWFGSPGENAHWYNLRGDWHKVNEERFPSGIRALSDYTHAKGQKFGIWCEIEACGKDADLTVLRPELIARRDGGHLGYVCMGNPETVKWAFDVFEVLIRDYKADWIKLDFNLDPGAGCNRTDHGHGEGDGLYAHYAGYYRLLDMVREKYPEVVLENCASGGMRLDLGMMKHLHVTFISDPDYSVHTLQLAWGAVDMFHPSACLRWSWSQCLDHSAHNVDNNPIKADMPLCKFDYMVRNSMLTQFGFSYKLPQFPDWCLERLKYHAGLYKDSVRGFVREADVFRLTGQALRSGGGDRWNGFLYVGENKEEAVLFVFRLPDSEKVRSLRLKGLDKEALYEIRFEDRAVTMRLTGGVLMETGILFDWLDEEASEVVWISRCGIR